MTKKYLYEVIESKSPEMPIGKRFYAFEKLHDNRTKDKIVQLADVKCRYYVLKFIEEKKL